MAATTHQRKRQTVEMTKAELLKTIMECPSGSKKAIDAYVAKVFATKKEEKEIAKPAPTIYQLFCYEQRPIITERLVDTGDYDDNNKGLFGAITRELSTAWKEAKKDPKYKKGSKWHTETLASKLNNKTPTSPDIALDAHEEDEDEDTSPVAKTSKKADKADKEKKNKKTTGKTDKKKTTKTDKKQATLPDPSDSDKEAGMYPYNSDDDIIFERRVDIDSD